MNLQTFQDSSLSLEHNAELRPISKFYFLKLGLNERVNFVNNLQELKLSRTPHFNREM